MMTLKLPDINGKTTPEQVAQIKTYLYQLANYLQFAQGTVQAAETLAVQEHRPVAAGSGEVSTESWNATKALILKSAQIVAAFTEKIDATLEGKYVAQSDFGTYTQETAQKISANSQAVDLLYTNVQTLDVQAKQVQATTAYLRSGLLDYDKDGKPVYGIEVGQRNQEGEQAVFDAYARFTAGKLSFYDNNRVEVAYISNYKMYITKAEITGSLTGGGYEVDFSDGWAWKWIGG